MLTVSVSPKTSHKVIENYLDLDWITCTTPQPIHPAVIIIKLDV
jgi:hypothetical protein